MKTSTSLSSWPKSITHIHKNHIRSETDQQKKEKPTSLRADNVLDAPSSIKANQKPLITLINNIC